MAQIPIMGVEIAGWGIGLPETQVSNAALIDRHDLAQVTPGITPQKIVELCGIEHRYIAGDHEDLAHLATQAGLEALDTAGLEKPYNNIAKVILATTTSDRIMPGTHATVRQRLGIKGGSSVELNNACAGFVTALVDGYRHFPFDSDVEHVLAIGGDRLSGFTDYRDGNTNILFGDGAGAVVLKRNDGADSGLLGWAEEGTNDDTTGLLSCEHGGTIYMAGRAVMKAGVELAVSASETALDNAGLEPADLKLFIPHQANKRILDTVQRRLGLKEDQVVSTVAKYGNNSGATIPLALYEAVEQGLVERGDKLMLAGFGAVMLATVAVVQW